MPGQGLIQELWLTRSPFCHKAIQADNQSASFHSENPLSRNIWPILKIASCNLFCWANIKQWKISSFHTDWKGINIIFSVRICWLVVALDSLTISTDLVNKVPGFDSRSSHLYNSVVKKIQYNLTLPIQLIMWKQAISLIV